MKIFIVDAFTEEIFKGNPAGVVLLEADKPWPDAAYMRNLAAELKHSETAFVKHTGKSTYRLRYFTPTGEVDLCGHATISAFTVLREMNELAPGRYTADTLAGELIISVENQYVWMDMAVPKQLYTFQHGECMELYSAFHLELCAKPDKLCPVIVNTGLSDILLPAADAAVLDAADADSEKISLLSRKYHVVGVHMFCVNEAGGATALCRNFAPLYGIREESATGTSNGALTYYLKSKNLISDGCVNTFIQGTSMGRESRIYTTIQGEHIRVGGNAKILLECKVFSQS